MYDFERKSIVTGRHLGFRQPFKLYMTHSSVLFAARGNFDRVLAWKLIEAWKVLFLCVSHNGHQLFGIGYHFYKFRSQVTTRKKS